MKFKRIKYINFITLMLCMLLFNLIGCGKSKEETQKEYAKEIDEYLESGDFKAAYNIVDRIRDSYNGEWYTGDFAASQNKRVMTEEISYVFSEYNDPKDLSVKLLLIINERSSQNSARGFIDETDKLNEEIAMLKSVISTASSLNNTELIENLESALDFKTSQLDDIEYQEELKENKRKEKRKKEEEEQRREKELKKLNMSHVDSLIYERDSLTREKSLIKTNISNLKDNISREKKFSNNKEFINQLKEQIKNLEEDSKRIENRIKEIKKELN